METLDMLIWLRDHGVEGLDDRTWYLTGDGKRTWAHAESTCQHVKDTGTTLVGLDSLHAVPALVCLHCVAALHPQRSEQFLLQMSRLRILLEDHDERVQATHPHHGEYPHLRAAALRHTWERHLIEDSWKNHAWRTVDPYLQPAADDIVVLWQDTLAALPQDEAALDREIVTYCANQLADDHTPFSFDTGTWEAARAEELAENLADTAPTVCNIVSYSLSRDCGPGDYRCAILRRGLLTTPVRTASGKAAFGRYPAVVAQWLTRRIEIGEIVVLPLGCDDPGLENAQWDTVVRLMDDAWSDETSPYNDISIAVRAAGRL